MMIKERSEWDQNGALRQVRTIPNSLYTHMEVHHSAGPRSSDDQTSIRLIRQYYHLHVGTNNWSDLFYNYIIDDNGTIWAGRKHGLRSSDDPEAMTVMILGDYTKMFPTDAVKRAILELNAFYFPGKDIDWHAARAERYGRHFSVCPGKNVIQWLNSDPTPQEIPSMNRTNAEYQVNWCYDKLLGRPADAGGLAYWTTRLVDGTITVENLRWEFQAVRNAIDITRAMGATNTQVEKFVKDLIDLARNA